MKLGVTKAPAARDSAGRFSALPDNPIDEVDAGRKASEWAPGIGQGTARTFDEPLPMTPAFIPEKRPMGAMRNGR